MNETNPPSDVPARRASPVLWAVVFVCLFITALSLALCYRSYGYSLDRDGHWYSAKTELKKGVMGAQAFMVTHRAVAGSALNLGVWHGHQELWWNDTAKIARGNFRFRLPSGTHFYWLAESTDGRSVAVRWSDDPMFPSGQCVLTNGHFTNFRPIDSFTPGNRWHTLEWASGNGIVTFSVDSGVPDTLPIIPARVGFRSTAGMVKVDHVQLYAPDGSPLLNADFTGRFPWWQWLVGLLVSGLMAAVFLRWTARPRRVLLIAFALLMTSLVLSAWYFQIGQYRYAPVNWKIAYGDKVNRMQQEREIMETPIGPDYIPEHELIEQYGLPDTAVYRILFIGSSQTWGAGATSEDSVWVERVGHYLQQRCHRRIEVINAGVSGQASGRLFIFHKYVTRFLEPDAVVINLSFNDRENEPGFFRQNLTEFVALNRSLGIETYLIPEPSYMETEDWESSRRVFVNRAVVRGVGRALGVPVIEVDQRLRKKMQKGLLFWDDVHLTDLGQFYMGTWVGEELFRQLPVCGADPEEGI